MASLTQMFQEYKGGPIAVYGLGTETARVLEEMGQEFQVIGLLDGYRDTGVLFGMPILSMEQAIEAGVKLILVAARPGSCKAIAKRIGNICKEKQIRLFDTRGKDLCSIQKAAYNFQNQKGIARDQLFKKIEDADVISFDLFDTLIMRRTLFSTDVFALLDMRLREQGILIQGFSEKRISSEKELSRYRAPTLVEIYSYMREIYHLPELKPEECALLEWQTDAELVIPRRAVCEILEATVGRGKNVYIVTDSYYTKQQIAGLMEQCGIVYCTDVLVSCEYGTGKTQSLFPVLKKTAGGDTYLHIGDDPIADVENAEKHGIEAVWLYSGIDLLEMCGYMGLWDSMDRLSDRVKIGMFVSTIFNSPFQFESETRKICVSNAFDIGYLFFAPLITDFVSWFSNQVRKEKIPNVFFCARDGYLIRKMYDRMKSSKESVYFLTSRMAAIRAGIMDEADIRYVEAMKFSGTLEEQLWERFGIDAGEAAIRAVGNGSRLSDYFQEIIRRAAQNRKAYKTYIESLTVREGDIALFDFVAKGTSQMFLGRLMKNHLKGLYFLQLDAKEMEPYGLDIEAFYSEGERAFSGIFDDYYILETMLTAPTPSVKEFDENGMPIYGEETRTEENIQCFREAQEGILAYFETYLRICPEADMDIEKKIDEIFLSLLHQVEIGEKRFMDLKVEDPFFNRMTNVTDLI